MSDDVSNEKSFSGQGDNGLSRQITLNLSADQYERLFFQPSGAKGDLAKRLGTAPLRRYSLSSFADRVLQVILRC